MNTTRDNYNDRLPDSRQYATSDGPWATPIDADWLLPCSARQPRVYHANQSRYILPFLRKRS